VSDAAEQPTMQSRPSRVVVERVRPEVDGGRFAIKRTIGERVRVLADAFCDGHDQITVVLRWRRASEMAWTETSMQAVGNDTWEGSFEIEALEPYLYTVAAATAPFSTWRHDLAKRLAAGQDVAVDLHVGAALVTHAARRASGPDAQVLDRYAADLRDEQRPIEERATFAQREDLSRLVNAHPDRSHEATYGHDLRVDVDRERARFSAWYELFPRSCAGTPGAHGTLRECEARLPYVAEMGFDVLYLPPIHPIGRTFRKGPNNAETADEHGVGSPWAIGGPEGGHCAIHPQLGSLADFDHFVARAGELDLEVALDLAFQCSPDHPYVTAHPEWFRHRPDGTIQYAENPPKKYQDIYPLDFECEAWRELWSELLSVALFWAQHGVRIFRVDNPHTKPFAFWEWLIAQVRQRYPETIFLAEAFTRPKVMYRLAKLGFSQSYTYFAWRNTPHELAAYLTELTQTEVGEYFRPNFWPNTPDILTEALQYGGRALFASRLILAATLSSSYGIYGPAFELLEATAREPGTEDYANSEKYQIRHWDIDRPDSLRHLIVAVNRARRENAALWSNARLRFHEVDNPLLLAYTKTTEDLSNIVLVVVNLDPHHRHSGHVSIPLETLGLPHDQPYQVHDILGGGRYLWYGSSNYVEIDPAQMPGHLFQIRRRLRRENDFDYFL
jgi:starch synthase (maltosyl-transferring)